MAFRVIIEPVAEADIRNLRRYERAAVLEAIETHLTVAPTLESKSRIKRLREVEHPQYRLRVDDIRVFYDVINEEVHVLTVLTKEEAVSYLEGRS